MHSMIEAVAEVFKQAGWKYELDADDQGIRAHIAGTNGDWLFWVLVEGSVMTMLSALPMGVPKARRSPCAELLTRINCASRIGVFTVDFDDGDLCCKYSFVLAGEIPAEQLNLLVHFSLERMDRYFPAIMAVVYAGVPPTEALQRANGDAKLVAACGKAVEHLGGDEFSRWRN